MGAKQFTRQPRFLPEMPNGEREIESPPSMPSKPEISWVAILLPPAAMIIITLMMAVTQQQGAYMLMSLGMTVVALLNSLMSVSRQKKKYRNGKRQRETKYLQYIADVKTELALQQNMQVAAMTDMHPDPNYCMNRIRNTDSKLWEKTPAHDDFLSVRVGIGNVPFAIKLHYEKQRFNLEDDPLVGEPQKIGLEYEKVNNVPVCMNLFKDEICGIVGENKRVMDTLSTIMLQIITNHGYDDVNIVLLMKDENAPRLEWMRFLPHLWDPDYKIRFMGCGRAMSHQVLAVLNDIIRARELAQKDENRTAAAALPHYVFVVDDTSLLEQEQIAKYLYNPNQQLGVSSIFTADNKAYLPTHCKTVLSVGNKAHELTSKDAGAKIIFNPDSMDGGKLDFIGRKLAPLRIKSTSSSFALPKSITLNQMYKITRTEEIDIQSRWLNNRTYMGMNVPIGARPGSELFHLDMHETGYGPHGLVAGTTGSGKSELLQSIIISLAMNYHPHDVVFVLIDYKGGGMADVFQGMQHLVGTITNLGGNQTTRALVSIKSELQRRQRIFSEHGVNNIDKYQKLFHNGGASVPVPHLIMIADEFAELKAEQPDFMKELVSTARVGRSLGVHLILATQKPGGIVDDQIWSNSKFKICLKVQDVTDSNDVIKREDAAYIKEPGRAYIQVGNDEVFELFQSAYAGADYDPTGEKEKSVNKDQTVYRVALNGRCDKVYPLMEEKIAKTELPSQLKSMVEHIIHTADSLSIDALQGPWPPPLAEELYVDDLFADGCGFDGETGKWRNSPKSLLAPVGIFDNPREQIQDTLSFDFLNDGNLFVYGMPGSGKTVFLQTLCLSLAHHFSPQDVCIYVLDFGGGSFRRMESLPHIGALMTMEETDKINQFLLFIFRVIETRKQVFLSAKVDGFVQYREKPNAANMPAMFVLLDNYTALAEMNDGAADQLLTLSREGLKYGVYVVATANQEKAYRFSVNFKMAVAFEMTDKGDYDIIVGRCQGLEPSRNAGRALMRHKPPLEFQAANCCYRNKNMEEILDSYDSFVQSGKIERAMTIPRMPDIVSIYDINDKSATALNIGLKSETLEPIGIDYVANHLFLVTGDSGKGKSTILASMVSYILKCGNAKIYLRDSLSTGLYAIQNLENVVNLEDIDDDYEFANEMTTMLDTRRSEFNECRTSGGDLAALKSQWEMIVFVIDNLVEFAENAPSSIIDLLERIAKKEAGMKVAIWVSGSTGDISNSYDTLIKIFKDCQCGLMLGSLKERILFNASLPYGSYEKPEFDLCEGYLVIRNKYASIKAAIDTGLL